MAEQEHGKQDVPTPEETASPFVMPPSDEAVGSISSGQKMASGPNLTELDLTPKGFNGRLKASQTQVETATSDTRTQSAHRETSTADTTAAPGLSIKTKLMGSLAMLTGIILLIGWVSVSSFVEINDLSLGITDQFVKLAKLAEESKTTVYRIRDAEKDFLLNEEQEALDRSTRFITKLRGQIEKAAALGEMAKTTGGVGVVEQFTSLNETADGYEQQFARQIKDIKQARRDVNKANNNLKEFQMRLGKEADANRLLIKNIVDDYWINVKGIASKVGGQEGKEAVNRLDAGILLTNLDRNLLEVQIQVARFLQEGRITLAETARFSVQNALDLVDRVRKADPANGGNDQKPQRLSGHPA